MLATEGSYVRSVVIVSVSSQLVLCFLSLADWFYIGEEIDRSKMYLV